MDLNDRYVELVFRDAQFQEELEGVLSQYESLGFLEEEDYWSCSFLLEKWNEIENEFTQTLHDQFPNTRFELHELETQNWNKNWESSITQQMITDRIIIAPSWETVDGENKIVVTIDPKMSFGTGYHPTTRLVLRLLEKYISGGETVLDIGTGTGVLAIAAVKLGAHSALGIDNDEWSYTNAIENVELNWIQNQIEIKLGTIDSAVGTFDIIAANITKNDIINLLPQILQHTHAKTILIFSGILSVESEEMQKEFTRYNLNLLEMITEEEWIAFAVTSH